MSNPKFKLGEAVMIRSKIAPDLNTDFAIITVVEFKTCYSINNGLTSTGWKYKTNKDTNSYYWNELCLKPIPPEESNGIDAIEYIKNLTGVTA